MSYTGTEIFDKAIAIIDEISDTGTINDTQVAEYKYRAPYLLDLWQKKMAKSGSLYNVQEYTNADATTLYQWIKFTIPSNLKSIKDMMFINDDSDISSIDYKRFGMNDIYFYFKDTGTVRMLYIPIPTKVTALTQTLEVDDIAATSGAYYLAEHFALADQNSELAAKCRNEFAELKNDSVVKSPLLQQEIKDSYGISAIK